MTREEWDQLSDKAQWDIKVAMRGPDSNYGEVLKWYTTAVIRGQVRYAFRVGGLYNTDLKLVVVPAGARAREEKSLKPFEKAGAVAWNWHHFTDHIITAARWLNVPRLYVTHDIWHAAMQIGTAKQAGLMILEAGKESASREAPEVVATSWGEMPEVVATSWGVSYPSTDKLYK